MKMLLKLYCYDIVLLEEHFFAAWVFHTQSRRFVVSSYKSEKVFQNILFGTVSQIEIDLCHHSGVSFLYHFPHLMNDFVWFISFFQLLPCTKRSCELFLHFSSAAAYGNRVTCRLRSDVQQRRVFVPSWSELHTPSCGRWWDATIWLGGNLVIFFTSWKGGNVVS